jgi:phosphoribosylamine--glycine ligase
MKLILAGEHGEGVALALRMQNEGSEVSLFVKDKEAKDLYKGIVPRVDNLNNIDKDTIVIFDTVKFGKLADQMRKDGYKLYGASQIADDLELDRAFGLPVAHDNGIEVPTWEEFKDFDSAIEFMEEVDAPYVCKPEANKEGIQTYVSSSAEDMIEMLEFYREKWTTGVDFILQEVIEGTEVSSEIWCVNGLIVPNSYNNTWETKRLMNNDLGPNTGCMSSVVKFNALPWLYDKTFAKLELWLRQVKYNGPLDINCMVKDGEPYFLEWTARMGYSAIYAFAAGLNRDLSEFFSTLATGDMPILEPSENWLGALRISIPPYPAEDCKCSAGRPARDLEDSENIWPLDIMHDGERTVTSGYDGIVCEVTGQSETLDGLHDELYDIADALEIPDKQYRTDAIEHAKDRIEQLEGMSPDE